MKKHFLENEMYTLVIAKIAILFQSFITSAMVTMLLCIVFGLSYPRTALLVLLFLDMMFVAFHLSYRRAYYGPKVVLRASEKIFLMIHIMTSLLSLGMTGLLIYQDLAVPLWFTLVTTMMWIFSLVFGLIFFMKKYTGTRVLR